MGKNKTLSATKSVKNYPVCYAGGSWGNQRRVARIGADCGYEVR